MREQKWKISEQKYVRSSKRMFWHLFQGRYWYWWGTDMLDVFQSSNDNTLQSYSLNLRVPYCNLFLFCRIDLNFFWVDLGRSLLLGDRNAWATENPIYESGLERDRERCESNCRNHTLIKIDRWKFLTLFCRTH